MQTYEKIYRIAGKIAGNFCAECLAGPMCSSCLNAHELECEGWEGKACQARINKKLTGLDRIIHAFFNL